MRNSVVHLTGGLGNQLFGAFFGLNLGKTLNSRVDLNKFGLEKRGYQLSAFENFLGPSISIINEPPVKLNKVELQIDKIQKRYYFEKGFQYNSSVFLKPYKEYFGYFQSWKYIEESKTLIRDIFRELFKNLHSEGRYSSFLESPYIAVHVRRGDYVNLTQYHGLTTRKYFENALMTISNKHNSKFKIIVFSDDIIDARKVVPGADFYVGSSEVESNLDNLLLMGNSEYFIGSNSSFSWWAAYTKEREFTIFPRPWFQIRDLDTSDLLPNSWLTLGI